MNEANETQFERAVERAKALTKRSASLDREGLLVRYDVGAILADLDRPYGARVVERFAEEIGWGHRIPLVYECMKCREEWPTRADFERWIDRHTKERNGVDAPPPWVFVQRVLKSWEDPDVITPEHFDERNARVVENAAEKLDLIRDELLRESLATLLADSIRATFDVDLSPEEAWGALVDRRPCVLTGSTSTIRVEIIPGEPFSAVPVDPDEAEALEAFSTDERARILIEGYARLAFRLLSDRDWPDDDPRVAFESNGGTALRYARRESGEWTKTEDA